MRAVVVERSVEIGRPLCPLRLHLHLHPIGRPEKDASGKDEKTQASPDYESENGHADVQRDPSLRTDAANVAACSLMEAEHECPRVFWLGTTCTEGLIGRPPGPTAAPAPTATRGAFPTLPGPDIVEPVAAAATVPAVFAEATGFVALLQNLMQRQKRSKVGTSDYYQGCVERLRALSSMVNRTQSAHSRSVRVWALSQSLEARARYSTRPGHLWSWCSSRRQCWVHNEHE